MRNLIILLLMSLSMPWGVNASEGSNVAEPRRKRVVVLDPGHGGPRPGKVVGSLHEADLVLEVALETRRMLATKMPDLEVYLTRSSDSAYHSDQRRDNRMRAEYANRLEADLTIGIHANAGPSTASGFEVWVLSLDDALMRQNQTVGDMYADEGDFVSAEELDPTSIGYMMALSRQLDNDPRNRNFARVCCDNAAQYGLRNRGVKSGVVYTLLYYLEGPGALVELGFLTNATERNYLNSARGKREMAEALSDAIVYFIQGLDTAAGYATSDVTAGSAAAVVQETTTSTTSNDEVLASGYTIQLISSTTEVDVNDYQFHEYRGMVRLLMGTGRYRYKYCYGSYASSAEAQADLARVRERFRDAYVVRYENGNIR